MSIVMFNVQKRTYLHLQTPINILLAYYLHLLYVVLVVDLHTYNIHNTYVLYNVFYENELNMKNIYVIIEEKILFN